MNFTVVSFLSCATNMEPQKEPQRKARGATLGLPTSSSRSTSVSFPRREPQTSYEESRGAIKWNHKDKPQELETNFNVFALILLGFAFP